MPAALAITYARVRVADAGHSVALLQATNVAGSRCRWLHRHENEFFWKEKFIGALLSRTRRKFYNSTGLARVSGAILRQRCKTNYRYFMELA